MSDVNPESCPHCYAVIMAGGSGTRLWPLSRKHKPKQFQSFISSKTLIQETYDRIESVVAHENIFVSTTSAYRDLVLAQLPHMSEKRLILEPDARNTAPAIALVAATILRHDPEAIIATVASDHAIENPEEFCATIKAAFATVSAHPEALVTIGINPTSPDTGLGYIKMGQESDTISGKRVFQVAAFKEKPDLTTAETYLTSWEYLWNAGYFIFAAESFARWTKNYSPRLHDAIAEIIERTETAGIDQDTLEKIYAQAPSVPIDTEIIEKLSPDHCLVIPSALRWSDVGSWNSLYRFLREKDGTHMVIRSKHLDLESQNTLVYSQNKLIATVGLTDLIIVETEDTILVAERNRLSVRIKKLLEKLAEEGYESSL